MKCGDCCKQSYGVWGEAPTNYEVCGSAVSWEVL